MNCANCGHNLPDDSEFCQYCGKELIEKTDLRNNMPSDKSSYNIETDRNLECRFCGHSLPIDSDFCQYCGKKTLIAEDLSQNKRSHKKINTKMRLVSFLNLKRVKFNRFTVIISVLVVLIISLSTLYVISLINNNTANKKITNLKQQSSESQNNITELNNKIRDLESKVDSLENEVDELEDEKWDNQFKLDFFDEHAAIVGDDGSGLYHKYDCPRFDASYFWIYNTEMAEMQGYRACPLCH